MSPFHRAAAALFALLALAPPAYGQSISVQAPARFAPVQALTYGEVGQPATAVTAGTPLPVGDASNTAFIGVTNLTVGTAATAGRSIAMICTAAGNVALTFLDASTLTVPVQAGLTILPFAVTTVASSGTTASCTYANLK